MKQCLMVLTVLCCSLAAGAQTVFPFTSRENRDTITAQLINNIQSGIVQPLNSDNYGRITGAFWAMELMLYKPANMHSVIVSQFAKITATPEWYQRSFFEMLYTLYQGKYVKEVTDTWQQLASPKVKAMALAYLTAAGKKPVTPIYTEDSLQLFFATKPATAATLTEAPLLDTAFLPGQLLVVSFQHANRDIPGYIKIRTAQHRWLTTADGKDFTAPQLARSISNLPWYLTNGNTPQGLYKLLGFEHSTIDWIGPTTNLQMQMPFESTAQIFLGDSTLTWKDGYRKLLGPLAAHESLWQSFYAGKLGRSEIIAHGTTIDPLFYQHQPYYPNTPSMGCLCSPEIWNDKGELVQSAQQTWITQLQQLGGGYGYLLVVELHP